MWVRTIKTGITKQTKGIFNKRLAKIKSTWGK